jgi:RNA exonuclease 1
MVYVSSNAVNNPIPYGCLSACHQVKIFQKYDWQSTKLFLKGMAKVSSRQQAGESNHGEDVFVFPSKRSQSNSRGPDSKRSKSSNTVVLPDTEENKKSTQSPTPTSKRSKQRPDPIPLFRRLNLPVVDPNQYESIENPTSDNNMQSPNFRTLNLPVTPFSIPNSQVQDAIETFKDSQKKSSIERKNLPLPKSTPQGQKWEKAVVETQTHARFHEEYNFQKYQPTQLESESENSSPWIKAKPFGDWCRGNPQCIAIDCEMCETQDPVTKKKNHKALCRISIINGDNPQEVLLDTLVKPDWPVSNYRTWINGIDESHLENVQFTLQHAQTFMLALCSEETVFVGHAVNNDLISLQMEHYCVADSSYLIGVKDNPDACPSLKDITKGLLDLDMPEIHDSVNDALMSFRCLEHWLEKGGIVDPVEKLQSDKKHGNKFATCQLFLHRIPKICKKANLEALFVKHTSIIPVAIQDIAFSGKFGTTVVRFRSPRHANLAFSTMESEASEDASGRLQKTIYLRNGEYLRVRKMVHELKNKDNSKIPKHQDQEESDE